MVQPSQAPLRATPREPTVQIDPHPIDAHVALGILNEERLPGVARQLGAQRFGGRGLVAMDMDVSHRRVTMGETPEPHARHPRLALPEGEKKGQRKIAPPNLHFHALCQNVGGGILV